MLNNDVIVLTLDYFINKKSKYCFEYSYINTIYFSLDKNIYKQYQGKKISNTFEYILKLLREDKEYILVSKYLIYIRVVMNEVVEVELLNLTEEELLKTDTGNIKLIYEKDFALEIEQYNENDIKIYKIKKYDNFFQYTLIFLIILNIFLVSFLRINSKKDLNNFTTVVNNSEIEELRKKSREVLDDLEKINSINVVSLDKIISNINLLIYLNSKYRVNYELINSKEDNLYIKSIFDSYDLYTKAKLYLEKKYILDIKNLYNINISGGKYIMFVFNIYD